MVGEESGAGNAACRGIVEHSFQLGVGVRLGHGIRQYRAGVASGRPQAGHDFARCLPVTVQFARHGKTGEEGSVSLAQSVKEGPHLLQALDVGPGSLAPSDVGADQREHKEDRNNQQDHRALQQYLEIRGGRLAGHAAPLPKNTAVLMPRSSRASAISIGSVVISSA